MGFFEQMRQVDYSELMIYLFLGLYIFIEIGLIVFIFIQALTTPWFEGFVVPELEYGDVEVDRDSFCLFFTGQVRFRNVNDCGVDFTVFQNNENDLSRGRRAFDFYDCNDWLFAEDLSGVADEMCDILEGGRRDLLQSRRLIIAALFFALLVPISIDPGAKGGNMMLAAILALAAKLKLQNSDFGEDFQLNGLITLEDNSTATIQFESNAQEYFLAPVILMWIYFCCFASVASAAGDS